MRAVDNARVKSLADSMDTIGLQQPITVWAEQDGDIFLIAGAHRVEAAKLLKWEWIDAVFMNTDKIDRQLWEIDENLIRADLTLTETAEHMSRRKTLWEQRSKSERTSPTLTGRGNKGFASDTADKTGISKRTINEAISRAENIPEDIRDLICGTDLDTGVYLDSLKKLDPDEQRKRVQADLAAPKTKPKIDPDEKQLEKLKSDWTRASSEVRRRFVAWVES